MTDKSVATVHKFVIRPYKKNCMNWDITKPVRKYLQLWHLYKGLSIDYCFVAVPRKWKKLFFKLKKINILTYMAIQKYITSNGGILAQRNQIVLMPLNVLFAHCSFIIKVSVVWFILWFLLQNQIIVFLFNFSWFML